MVQSCQTVVGRGVDHCFISIVAESARYANVFIGRESVNKCKASRNNDDKSLAVIMITQIFDIKLKINDSILNGIGC